MAATSKAGHSGSIKLKIFESYDQMSRAAADIVVGGLRANSHLLLCGATGASPTKTYALLGRRRKLETKLFDHLRVLKLDEWGALASSDPASSEIYLREHLLIPAGVSPDRYVGFCGNAVNPELECRRIHQWLQKNGPIDICLLGLGLNGHLALNEPGEALQPFSHVARLSKTSLRHPMLRGANRKPAYGLTIGMADILQSRTILLLVSGPHKRAVFRKLFSRKINPRFPASFLWLHPNVICLSDRDAAAPTSDVGAIRGW